MRAARDLQAEEELTHCYGPHISRLPREQRRKLLLDQYFFKCECASCSMQVDPHQHAAYLMLCSCGAAIVPPRPDAPETTLQCSDCGVVIDSEQFQSWLKTVRTLQEKQHSARSAADNGHLDVAASLLKSLIADRAHVLHPKSNSNGVISVMSLLTDCVNRPCTTWLHKCMPWLAILTMRRTIVVKARVLSSKGMVIQHPQIKLSLTNHAGADSMEYGLELVKLAQLEFNARDSAARGTIQAAQRLLEKNKEQYKEDWLELAQMMAYLPS